MSKTEPSYEVFYVYADGSEKVISWPKFTSAWDVSAALATLATMGIPPDVVRCYAKSTLTNEWIAEVTRRPMG